MTGNRTVLFAFVVFLFAVRDATSLGAPAVTATQRNPTSLVRQETANESLTPTPSPSPPNLPYYYLPDPTEVDRHFVASKDAPMTNILAGALNESYWNLLRFVEHIERAVVYATNTSQNLNIQNVRQGEEEETTTGFGEGDALLTTCNYRNDGWRAEVEKYFGIRGLTPPDFGCISDVYGSERSDGIWYPQLDDKDAGAVEDAFNPKSMFQKISYHSSAVQNKTKQVVERVDMLLDGSWTRARNFQYEVRTQSCSYDYVGFVKVSRTWYVAERITDADKDVISGQNKRTYLYEFIRPGAPPVTMRLKNETSGNYEFATTSGARFTGGVTGSAFGDIFASDNLAVERALQRGEHQTQQASDATTPSNIAILAFPLVMNVVPVALIAEVNTFGMLVYTLLTDVLTAVPLAIKGVEVLVTGAKSNEAIVTRITGANLPLENAVVTRAAESWVATCRATGSFKAKGVTLLVVALTFMIGGVLAEFWAKHWVARRALLAQQQQQQQQKLHYSVPYGGETWGADGKPLLTGNQAQESDAGATSTALSATVPSSTTAAVLIGAGLNARQQDRDRIYQSGPGSDLGSAPGSRSSSGTQQPSPPPSIGARGPFDLQGNVNPKKTA